MGLVIRQSDVFLIRLDPTQGSEISKTRPCMVVSPDVMNRHLQTIIVAPMTTKDHAYPTRIPCTFQSKHGYVVLDQLRAVTRGRLVKRLGRIAPAQTVLVMDALREMFVS
jgi:mRNA interferase MazF